MCGNEIKRQIVVTAIVDNVGHPRACRRGGTAHLILVAYRSDCSHRGLVQLKVFSLVRRPKALQVRLVPNLKEPLLHLVLAVALGYVIGEIKDQIVPIVIAFWGSHVHLVPEHSLSSAGEQRGHGVQLHKGLHADGKQEIKNLVHVVPVVTV